MTTLLGQMQEAVVGSECPGTGIWFSTAVMQRSVRAAVREGRPLVEMFARSGRPLLVEGAIGQRETSRKANRRIWENFRKSMPLPSGGGAVGRFATTLQRWQRAERQPRHS